MALKRQSRTSVIKSQRSSNRGPEKLAGTRAGIIEDWRSTGAKAKGKAQRTANVRDGR